MLLKSGSIIQCDWHRSLEGREALLSILHRNMHHRKLFGLLESPLLATHIKATTVQYKLFVSGRSGVGKTSLLAKLSGNAVPSSHSETPGINTQIVYWPTRLIENGAVILYKLHFWDAGEASLKKFDHILPACKENSDAVLFLFSFTDRTSFDELPRHMSRILEQTDNACRIVIGTKYDEIFHSDVTHQELREFELQWKIPVLKFSNVTNYDRVEVHTQVNEVGPLLNTICEYLWHRDQLAAGVAPTNVHQDEDENVLYF